MIAKRSRTQHRLLCLLLVSVSLFFGNTGTARADDFCDPGDHFIGNCGSGVNYVEGHLNIGIDTSLDGVADIDGIFVGYVRLVRSDPLDDSINFPGFRPVDGHFGVIDVEMPSMRSTGLFGTAAAGWTIRTGINSGVNVATLGAAGECEPGQVDCEQHLEDPAWAYSIFHLFFEIDIPGMGTLHNYNPALPDSNAFLIGTEIDRAPPGLGTHFEPMNSSTPFFDENGTHVANVTASLTTRDSSYSTHASHLRASLVQGGIEGDGYLSLVYVAETGEVRIDVPSGFQINSINIDSANGIFTGNPAEGLDDNPDNNDTDHNIIKSVAEGSFGSTSFGNVAQTGLSEEFLLADLSVVGSMVGGIGAFGDLDLVYYLEVDAVEGSELIPDRVILTPPVPNPTASALRYGIGLPMAARVQVRAFDAGGRPIHTLMDRELSAGFHQLSWDLAIGDGSKLANGIYFLRLEAGGTHKSRKFTLMR